MSSKFAHHHAEAFKASRHNVNASAVCFMKRAARRLDRRERGMEIHRELAQTIHELPSIPVEYFDSASPGINYHEAGYLLLTGAAVAISPRRKRHGF